MRISASRSMGCGACRQARRRVRQVTSAAGASWGAQLLDSGASLIRPGDVPVLALDLLGIVGERQPLVALARASRAAGSGCAGRAA